MEKEKQTVACAICGARIELYALYPNRVCNECDSRAAHQDGTPVTQPPPVVTYRENGTRTLGLWDPEPYNPVYIDGRKCGTAGTWGSL